MLCELFLAEVMHACRLSALSCCKVTRQFRSQPQPSPWPHPPPSALQAADALHLTGRGREREAMRHPYLAALRQLLLELLPRPSLATQQLPSATPAKGVFV